MKSTHATHKDLEFCVDAPNGAYQDTYKNFEEACAAAITQAYTRGTTVNLDVITHSKAAARKWSGDDGVASYEEDPEASVFERLEIKVNSVGRVP